MDFSTNVTYKHHAAAADYSLRAAVRPRSAARYVQPNLVMRRMKKRPTIIRRQTPWYRYTAVSSAVDHFSKNSKNCKNKHRHGVHAEPAQTTPEPPDGGHGGKRVVSRCKGGPKRALLVVKGRIYVGVKPKGMVRLERAT